MSGSSFWRLWLVSRFYFGSEDAGHLCPGSEGSNVETVKPCLLCASVRVETLPAYDYFGNYTLFQSFRSRRCALPVREMSFKMLDGLYVGDK